MRRAAMVLSAVASITAILFYVVEYFPFPPLGFEWLLYIAVLTGWLCVLSSVVALTICAILYWRSNVHLTWTFLCAVAAGSAILIPAALGNG